MKKLKEYIEVEIFDGKKFSYLRLLQVYFFGSGGQKVFLRYRLAKNLYLRGYRKFSLLLFRKLENGYGVYISPNAFIGIGLKFPHPTGIVIGNGVNIGEYCTIYQQVTFGGARIGDAKKTITRKSAIMLSCLLVQSLLVIFLFIHAVSLVRTALFLKMSQRGALPWECLQKLKNRMLVRMVRSGSG